MQKISSIEEAELALAKYIPKVKELLGKDLSLDRMAPLMEALDNPQDKLRIVHIAGTSGKTSTAYYISALLKSSGKKVGLSVSPHIDTVTERIQVKGSPISDQAFCEQLSIFLEIIERSEIDPTYFELLIAFAYWYFAKEAVDYAVVETGLGGLVDSTNIATRPDKVCVITDIGMDHMHVLGNHIKDIALQKAGIIQKGNQAFKFQQNEEIDDVFKQYAAKQTASLILLESNTIISELTEKYTWLNNLPLFQRRNWSLAFKVYEAISAKDKLDVNEVNLKQAAGIKIPGRMNIVSLGDKKLVLDGAHNTQKMQALVDSFKAQFPSQRVPVLLSMKAGKEYQEILPILLPITSSIILTSFSIMQDRASMSADLSDMERVIRQTGFNEVTTIPDQTQAYNQFVDTVKSVGLITGSFYLIAQLRHNHSELHNG